MEIQHQYQTINHKTLHSLLNRYPDHVPKQLEELENDRYTKIPSSVAQRDPPYFTRAELITLMDWKLSHGKFRPALPKLIRSNEPKIVETTTREALQALRKDTGRTDLASLRTSLHHLTQLRGVGPATASLLISVYSSEHIPFFSDEFYRWTHFSCPPGTTKATSGAGWDRKIDYSVKAYLSLCEKVAAFQGRMKKDEGVEVGALEVEKVAYVLGKMAGGEAERGEGEERIRREWLGKGGDQKRKRNERLVREAEEKAEVPTNEARAENPPKKRRSTRKVNV